MHFKNCPYCNASMIDSEIPQKNRCTDECADKWDDRTKECLENHHYGKEAQYFYRSISVEVPKVYDGGLYVQCPDCEGTWHRWPEGHPLRAKAKTYIHGPKCSNDCPDWKNNNHKFSCQYALPPAKNSCDGCAAGMPIENGVHINEAISEGKGLASWDHNHMTCTKDLYR